MALDFYRLDNNELLFRLDDRKYNYLSDIFETFKQWTGIFIDQYGDLHLSTENQATIIKIIDGYINHTNLNQDKQKTISILGFRELLTYFSERNINFKLLGD